MERITSLQNPLVKELKKLNTASARREKGLFLIEGRKLCEEALHNGVIPRYCLATNGKQLASVLERFPECCCYETTEAVIEKLSAAKSPQGIVLVGVIPQEEGRKITGDRVLALDGISDPANLGSMLRTAEAFGITEILTSETTVDLYSTKVLRGAMGSSFRVRVLRGKLSERLLTLKEEGYSIVVSALRQESVLLHKTSFPAKTVIVIGNEGNGVTEEILALADQTVLIPMAGQNESLNAAAAAAVLMWHAYKGGTNGQ